MPIDSDELHTYTDGSYYSDHRRVGIGIRFILLDESRYVDPLDVTIPSYNFSEVKEFDGTKVGGGERISMVGRSAGRKCKMVSKNN